MYVNNTLVSHHSYSLIHSTVIGELSVCIMQVCLQWAVWHEWDEEARQERAGDQPLRLMPEGRKGELWQRHLHTKSASHKPLHVGTPV